MFDKKLLFQHIENRPRTLEEQNRSGPDDLQKPRYNPPMGRFRGGEDGGEEVSAGFRRSRAYVTQHPETGDHIYTPFPDLMINGVESVSVRDPNGPNGYMHVELPKGYKLRDEVHPDHEPSKNK